MIFDICSLKFNNLLRSENSWRTNNQINRKKVRKSKKKEKKKNFNLSEMNEMKNFPGKWGTIGRQDFF